VHKRLSAPHSFEDALRAFTDLYNGVEVVVDVGVQGKTEPLLKVFPFAKHILFEPVTDYLPEIEKKLSRA
jgi:hypothetical protein